ncbi:AMP-binding protein [Actinocorallia sp. B10E7]|uniref:AMP-binding protein n=1 Tax=Actinocorallia sp. B10E7 TaxID=3153558 RepID=UPI00325C592C
MAHPLTAWLTDPRAGRGIGFADDSGGWTRVGYPELAADVRAAAAYLAARGAGPGTVVCVVMPSGRELVTTVFAAWAAGATVSLPVPQTVQPDAEYVARTAPVLRAAAPSVTVCGPEALRILGRAWHEAGEPGVLLPPGTAPEQGPVLEPGEPALLQFTSGSSGTPKGVRVTGENLAANFRHIRRTLDFGPDSSMASWLPLHHDMGLIGCLLFTVSEQADLSLMRPDQFMRDPVRWLECFGPGGATHTAAPSFAFGYAARRTAPERIKELDLSGWRSVIVGAEPVDVRALAAFLRFAAPAGFSARTFQPGYGLAEGTLLVTANPFRARVRVVRPAWAELTFGARVTIERESWLDEADGAEGWTAGHGLPAGGEVTVRIVGEDGESLPDGHLGEIVVGGGSVADGYQDHPAPETFVGGLLRTADAGFVHEGRLYVLGRMGDSLKVSARSVYMEDLEGRVAAAAGLAPGRVCVVGAPGAGRPGVAVIADEAPGPWVDAARGFLREELGPMPVVSVATGPIRRTSSGKPRRRLMWSMLQEGRYSRLD